MVEGLSHITFIVRDLDRMEQLLCRVLGARKVYDSGPESFSLSPERFFLLGGDDGGVMAPAPLWIAIMQGEPLPTRTYNHVAFKIREQDFDTYQDRVESLGLEFRQGRPRVDGEGRSLYFHTPDNHLLELHTGTLADRLATYVARPGVEDAAPVAMVPGPVAPHPAAHLMVGEGVREVQGELVDLCRSLFSGFQPSYLRERLARIPDPVLVYSRGRDGGLLGFKLAYPRGGDVLYSWLGGVHPAARRRGIARQLMEAQHRWAGLNGYRFIETRTRAHNPAMITLNLSCGFEICGFEQHPDGYSVVLQRLALLRGRADAGP